MNRRARVLVIANRTAESPELMAALREIDESEPSEFTLVVPAVPHGVAWAADMKAGLTEADERASAGRRQMEFAGLEVRDATTGDPDPFSAADDALWSGTYDRIVVSTLPRALSRWLRVGLPHRLRRVTHVPVDHVETTLGAPETEVRQGRRLGVAV